MQMQRRRRQESTSNAVTSGTGSGRLLAVVLLQTYLLLWFHVDGITAQYDYEGSNGASGTSARRSAAEQGQQQIAAAALRTAAAGPNQWDSWNQAMLDKCMQAQRMATKKRNFGLEIPDIIMNRVQGGTEGNPALKEMRMRMMASGKRK